MSYQSPLLADADADLARALADVTPAEAVAHVNGKWSAADICEHLALAFTLNGKAVSRAVAERRVRLRPATIRQRFWKHVVLGLGWLPPSRSPEAVRPRGEGGAVSVDEVQTQLAALDASLAEAARVFGKRTPILNHPVLGPFSVRDWRRFHQAHVRHHMKQVRERVLRLRRQKLSVAQ